MLRITIPESEGWDAEKEEFVKIKEQTLVMEHSLVSLSKWEAIWQVPFLKKGLVLTEEMNLDYYRCMTLTQNVNPDIYKFLTPENRMAIMQYIESPQTATTFSGQQHESGRSETITSELIYYWMVAQQIPFECQKWHLNRLLTLIRVCNIKNKPPKKMSKGQLASRNRALNAARRHRLGTTG